MLLIVDVDPMPNTSSLPPLNSAYARAAPHPPERSNRTQQVRDVALSMFVSDGYANVSLRHLGTRVGVQAGSLYNHLESKQALLFDLIHEHLQGLVETVVHRTRKSTSAPDKLKIFVRIHLEFQIRQQASAKLMGLESRSLDDAHKVEVKTLLSQYRGLLSDIIASGIRSGSFPDQHVPSSTDAVLGMLCSVAFWFHEGQPQSLKQLTQQITIMVNGALCAPIRSH